MRLTRFFKLRQALADLDVNYVANKIAEIESCLSQRGKDLEPENTAFTQEGIYYIHPESGMATRVVLYNPDQRLDLKTKPKHEKYKNGYTDEKTYKNFNTYHLLRCNSITDAELNGWKESFRIVQRSEPNFYYRLVREGADVITDKDIYQEIESQKLQICQNCFWKIHSLLEGVHDFQRESFELRYFFDVDFFGAWCRYGDIEEDGSLSLMCPKDWQEISRIRKEQVQHHCEGCQNDFSDPRLRHYLHVQPTDHQKRNVGYVKLQCLCVECLSDQPGRKRIREEQPAQLYLRP